MTDRRGGGQGGQGGQGWTLASERDSKNGFSYLYEGISGFLGLDTATVSTVHPCPPPAIGVVRTIAPVTVPSGGDGAGPVESCPTGPVPTIDLADALAVAVDELAPLFDVDPRSLIVTGRPGPHGGRWEPAAWTTATGRPVGELAVDLADDPLGTLATIGHELAHAAAGLDHGIGWQRAMVAAGFAAARVFPEAGGKRSSLAPRSGRQRPGC